MGELEEAIREHLELKRRRGADAAEVAREEQEALAPVTRSHPVVVAEAPIEARPLSDAEGPGNGSAVVRRQRSFDSDADRADVELGAAPADEPLDDATQEFRVGGDDDVWLDDDEA